MSKLYRKNSQDKRGKWSDVFKALFAIVLVYMCLRWIVFEPFVIPSGSMENTLLVQDYVVVKKWAYGLRLPFTENWLVGPETPKRGDIVVFKSTDDSGHFVVKRVVGLPGETVSMSPSGHISIDGAPFSYVDEPSEDTEGDYQTLWESNGLKTYRVRYYQNMRQEPFEEKVPAGHLFMMGDNRNQSADSRFWGPLPIERIMGKLQYIWLSCRESDTHSSFLCPPEDFRLERMFTKVR